MVMSASGHGVPGRLNMSPVKITKMWRKLGAWFWMATQNVDDVPPEASALLNMASGVWNTGLESHFSQRFTDIFRQNDTLLRHAFFRCIQYALADGATVGTSKTGILSADERAFVHFRAYGLR